MMLREFGINITPVLTGAGIAGLAVGFGAQTLVRDIISGFFLILEDQVRVGDVAAINGVGGLVEQINLRTIVLRDEEGAVHVFPNGAITTLANRSKDYSYYVITLGAPYSEDSDRVVAIAARGRRRNCRPTPRYGPFILDPIEILGVDAFGDWSVQLKMRIKTVPLKQWEVGPGAAAPDPDRPQPGGRRRCRSRRWAATAHPSAPPPAKAVEEGQPTPPRAQ